MPIVDDPNDPRIKRGPPDEKPVAQHDVYLVLSEQERKAGFVRPVRTTYVHDSCGTQTTMGLAIAETYARDPYFYGSTYCCKCSKHRPLSEFHWLDGSRVGS